MTERITALTLPKWGLSMQDGCISTWHVEEGARVSRGDEIVDIETEKINNAFEAPSSGVLRRQLAREGDEIKVGALFGIIAEADVGDDEIARFIEAFDAP
ncbi:biotin/lipoyl-containing protein [Halomonas sp. MA07-2]|uniref:biotin/lipoyl-containing protein n=1 Tax=Halomonas sp. MA07-2 TaxID=3440841 RepID=UPI003EEDA663